MTLDPRITFSRASTATYFNASGMLATAVSGAPRFDYNPVTHAARGLLIEEARTNFATQSQDLSQAVWVKTGVTATVDQIAAPDGTITADMLTASATTAFVALIHSAIATTMVYSVFVKKGTSDWVYLVGRVTGTGAEDPKAYFNLATGAIGTVETNVSNATIDNVGNGWYRCSIQRAATAGTEAIAMGPCDANGSAAVTIGRTVYCWGAQVEGPSLATSYIPTLTSSVARAADVATMTGTAFSSWYAASAGTFVAEFDVLAASGTRGIVSADNAATSERIWLYSSGTDPKVAVTDGGTAQADIDVGTIAANTIYKLGISYALNDIAGCLNGGTVGTDTSATMPTPTQLRIGADATPNYLNGHLRRIRFYNVAKSDADLQALTT